MEKVAQIVPKQFDRVAFYVVAHADDWQLFMYPNVYKDLVSPRCKTVFIITTAGDGGMDKKFWMSREEGSKSSIRFCLAPYTNIAEKSGDDIFNKHPVHHCSINNTITYFLRLPDGNLNGNGHELGNFESLTKLQTGQSDTIAAIDQSTTYKNWDDLITTIESIIHFEKGDLNTCSINYPNPDARLNPGDHPDHIATGYALQQLSFIKQLHQFLFVGYDTRNTAAQLSTSEVFYKTAMFAVYDKAVYDASGYSTLKENPELYIGWCSSKARFIEVVAGKE